MHYHKSDNLFRRRASGLPALLALAIGILATGVTLTAGCGSGNSGGNPASNSGKPSNRATGTVQMTLLLPAYEPSRLIPGVAREIRLNFKVAGNALEIPADPTITTGGTGITVSRADSNTTVVVKRADDPASTQFTLKILVPVADGIVASAETRANGIVLSSAQEGPFNLSSGPEQNLTLDLESKIQSLDLVEDITFPLETASNPAPTPANPKSITAIPNPISVGTPPPFIVDDPSKIEAIGRPTDPSKIVRVTASKVTWTLPNLGANPPVALQTSLASNKGLELTVTAKKSTYTNNGTVINVPVNLALDATYNEGTAPTNKTVTVNRTIPISILPLLTAGGASATPIDQSSGTAAANASTSEIVATLKGANDHGTNGVQVVKLEAIRNNAPVDITAASASVIKLKPVTTPVTNPIYDPSTDTATYTFVFTAPTATADGKFDPDGAGGVSPIDIAGSYRITLAAKDAPALTAQTPITIAVNPAVLDAITFGTGFTIRPSDGALIIQRQTNGDVTTQLTGIKGASVTWDARLDVPDLANTDPGLIPPKAPPAALPNYAAVYKAPPSTGRVRIIAEVKFGATVILTKDKTIEVIN